MRSISRPGAESLRDLIDRSLVRLTTDEAAIRAIRKNRKSGVAGFSGCFDPKTRSAKTIVAIDSDKLMSKGPIYSKDSVRNMLIKFEACSKLVEKKDLQWQYVEDSEVEVLLKEIESGGGKDYDIFDISYSS